MLHHQTEHSEETRYDPETLRKVIALASRLQERHQDTLTADQIETAGAEVGLEPAYIRQALSHYGTRAKSATSVSNAVEFNSVLFALAFPLVWGTVAFLGRHSPDLLTIFSQVTPAPLAGLLGFISGKRKVGFLAGVALALALTPVFAEAIPHFFSGGPYVVVLPLVGGWLGSLGASLRERHFPFQSSDLPDRLSSPDVIGALARIQAELEAKKQLLG